MIETPAFRTLLQAVDGAESQVLESLFEGDVETEPSFTDQLVSALKSRLGGTVRVGGLTVGCRVLRSQGKHSPERQVGADLVSVFRVSTSRFEVNKGFLAQAKMVDHGEVQVELRANVHRPRVRVRVPKNSVDNPSSLQSQCLRMLTYTPDSYVFCYARSGVYVIPATTIANLEPKVEWSNVYWRSFHWFMNDFFQCFVGDSAIEARDDASLARLRTSRLARSALLLEMHDDEAKAG